MISWTLSSSNFMVTAYSYKSTFTYLILTSHTDLHTYAVTHKHRHTHAYTSQTHPRTYITTLMPIDKIRIVVIQIF